MTLCAAVNYKNTGTHLFPKDIKRRKLWEKALRRKNWNSSNFSRLCSGHFKQEDFHITNSYTSSKNLHKILKKNPISQQASWSSYKHNNTLTILVGTTPGGLLSDCSPAYAGSISDRQTVERSDILYKLEPGDSVMADRGYNIQDMFIGRDIILNIPTFLKGKSQVPGLKILEDRRLASKCVHIERFIGFTKTCKILKEELTQTYVPLASKIFFVCLMCCNLENQLCN